MTDQRDQSGAEPLVNFRNLKKFVIYPVLALAALYLLPLWLGPAFDGFRMSLDRRGEISPLVAQAREDAITYGQAVAGASGRYVVWCVQNRDEWDVTVDGDRAKRVGVSNYAAMPRYTGNKHQACVPMLLLLEKPAAGEKVRVFFKEALE